MRVPCCDGLYVIDHVGIRRCCASEPRAIAENTVVIAAPTAHAAGVGERARGHGPPKWLARPRARHSRAESGDPSCADEDRWRPMLG